MEVVGTIVRLQVQRSSLKLGDRPRRWYEPAPLVEVAALELEDGGVVGVTAQGERLVDVHNRRHPVTRHGTGNGVSIGFTSHYGEMRDRFGVALSDGIAGENVIVRTERAFKAGELPAELVLETQDGAAQLVRARPIEPCVEFSRYALGFRGAPGLDLATPAEHDAAAIGQLATAASGRPDPVVKETLVFLRGGMRGYCAMFERGARVVRVEDRLLIP